MFLSVMICDNHEVLATERAPKGNPEGLGEMMERVLHAVQLAVPIGIITRPNIAQRSNLCNLVQFQPRWSG